MEKLELPTEFMEMARESFRLLKRESQKHKRNVVEIRVSGYGDLAYLVSDLLKVSILVLENMETSTRANIPNPECNVAGVLSIVLDLLPFEEMELLDKIRDSVLEPVQVETDWEFLRRCCSLVVPRELRLTS